MSQMLTDIAQQLKDNNKKVQLIYAFNGVGKTRLSREFKDLISPKNSGNDADEDEQSKVLYYNAFTEDLFYWDNDLEGDSERKLIIQPNKYTHWALQVQGQDQNAISHFQRYTNPKLMPEFSPDFSEVTFSFQRGNNQPEPNIKISKGEESNFIWSIFYSLLEQIIDGLNSVEKGEIEASGFEYLEYVFIDDPVSSLDENHLMQLAVDLASLIKSSHSSIKFIISTHDTTFYNFLYNELNAESCFLLDKLEDDSVSLVEKNGDSNTSFFYHLDLKKKLELAIDEGNVQKHHFAMLRNLYEKTASFLGYPKWSALLPGDDEENKEAYLNRIIQFSSHDTLANSQTAFLKPEEKQIVRFLLKHLIENYSYWQQEQQNG
jgi:hypothetical protein